MGEVDGFLVLDALLGEILDVSIILRAVNGVAPAQPLTISLLRDPAFHMFADHRFIAKGSAGWVLEEALSVVRSRPIWGEAAPYLGTDTLSVDRFEPSLSNHERTKLIPLAETLRAQACTTS